MKKYFFVLILTLIFQGQIFAQFMSDVYKPDVPYHMYLTTGYVFTLGGFSDEYYVEDQSAFVNNVEILYRMNSDWRFIASADFRTLGLIAGDMFYGEYSNLRIGTSSMPFRSKIKHREVSSFGLTSHVEVGSTSHIRAGYQRQTAFFRDGTKGNNIYFGLENRRTKTKYQLVYGKMDRISKELVYYADLVFMPFYKDRIVFDEYVDLYNSYESKNLGYRIGFKNYRVGSHTWNQLFGLEFGNRPEFYRVSRGNSGLYFTLTYGFIIAK